MPRPAVELTYLSSALNASIAERHRYIVAKPLAPGPQPALIEVTIGKTVQLRDALIVLPASVPSESACGNRVYSAAMTILRRDYRVKLAEAVADERVIALSKLGWDQPPFIPLASVQTSNHLSCALAQLIDIERLGYQSTEALLEEIRRVAFWNPQHLANDLSVRNADSQQGPFATWKAYRKCLQLARSLVPLAAVSVVESLSRANPIKSRAEICIFL